MLSKLRHNKWFVALERPALLMQLCCPKREDSLVSENGFAEVWKDGSEFNQREDNSSENGFAEVQKG